ncbi:UdgX family uracil-DNA binding protein [Bdellovibrio reynosensis]|uniref:Type-4 uracil-DNA glycosylase n=1 Tax=Bdellovibrio reynosensis TaxID=2835041 RepID=A0ABY4CET5_9BACT|nr:UdgX family uracil-DNA binding protein [Bdellovibrio reynosensis]UOF02176.1 UdgX family uracil-DNA binding protein [Bdellovibrio reynosensis]
MAKKPQRQANPPDTTSLKKLAQAAQECTGCDLYKNASQAVFGQGSKKAKIMIVGEQPGDKEDLAGLPFVGPAGELLRHCITEAGLSIDDIYLTNAVKHFKWKPAGKVRLHQKPSLTEIRACHPWLEKEMEAIKPKIIIALGATAATSVLGRVPKISTERGKVIQDDKTGDMIIISWHPSAILRGYDLEDSDLKRAQLIADLKLAKKKLT